MPVPTKKDRKITPRSKPHERKAERERRRMDKRQGKDIPAHERGNTHRSRAKQKVVLEPERKVKFELVGIDKSFHFASGNPKPLNGSHFVKSSRFAYQDGQVVYAITQVNVHCLEYAEKIAQNG